MLCSHERLVERTSPALPARVVHHRLRPQARGGGAARRPADRGQADRRRHRVARQPASDAGPREEAVGARRDLLRTAREVPRRQRQARPGRGRGRGRARTAVARGVRRRLPRRRERAPPRRREQPLQRRHDHPDRDRRRPGRNRAAQRRVAGARAARDQGVGRDRVPGHHRPLPRSPATRCGRSARPGSRRTASTRRPPPRSTSRTSRDAACSCSATRPRASRRQAATSSTSGSRSRWPMASSH